MSEPQAKKMKPEEIIREQIAWRKDIATTPAQRLLECFKATLDLVAVRDMTKGLGLHDDDPHVDQQYRLTVYALEQELLRRLTAQ